MEIQCPACNSTRVRARNMQSREGFQLSINQCEHCGHFFQDPNAYKDVYSTGEFSEQARESREPTAEKIKELDKRALERAEFYAAFLSNRHRVLEAGSSIGSFLHLLKLMGKEVIGLEPDPAYAKFSTTHYFFEQDTGLIENYNPEKVFDLVCSFHVIEHVQHLGTFLDKVWRLLDSDGALLFECPSLDIHCYGNMRETIWKPHLHYFTLASMYALISQRFRVIELGYYGMSLYVYARKSNESTFNGRTFLSYRKKSRRTSRLISIMPAVGVGPFDKYKVRQLALQPVLQKDTARKISKYINLGAFAAKSYVYKRREEGFGSTYATHISYYSAWENAGDTVLSKSVRRVFQSSMRNSWRLKGIKDAVDDQLVSTINRGKYLLIGGGGLLLPDSNKNSVSGWQWAVSKEQLRGIQVPVVVYAIGYNYFRGQQPGDLFIENLNALVERSDFFSLRNHGSIEKVKPLLAEPLRDKIIYQPCPTTVISKFFRLSRKTRNNRNVGFNLAFDRYEKRFGKDIYTILDQLALSAKRMEENGYHIHCVNHLKGDNKFELALARRGVGFKSVNLQYTLPGQTIEFYNHMGIILGARGHAQMIPFGVNTRILSLGTHDKLRYFLEDISATDWYEDVTEEPGRLADRLLDRFFRIHEQDQANTDERLAVEQEKLYRVTLENSERLKSLITRS